MRILHFFKHKVQLQVHVHFNKCDWLHLLLDLYLYCGIVLEMSMTMNIFESYHTSIINSHSTFRSNSLGPWVFF